ncbi:hypothetical protein OXX69_008700 [Metschnikowia pulcherrima]
MKLLMIWIILCTAVASEDTTLGMFVISRIGGEDTRRVLYLQNDHLVVRERRPIFDLDKNGTITLFNTHKFLSICADGRLSTYYKPHAGFSLTSLESWDHRKVLSFHGKSEFFLCADNSIDFEDDCKGARSVSIVWESLA